MARILGIGIATVDIINTVNGFPEEDTEVRAIAQSRRRGGNVTNTLVVLSQLGNQTAWAGTLADDSNSQLIRSDLARYSVDMNPVALISQGHAPTSYITLNQQNGSRTIVHYRNLEEYTFESFKNIDLAKYDWLHFEGRNVDQTLKMLEFARETVPEIPRSVEIEKSRPDIEALCSYANLLLYSRSYVQDIAAQVVKGSGNHPDSSSSYSIPANFLENRFKQTPTAHHICTWGEHGAYGIDPDGTVIHAGTFKPDRIIDTLGAGDTFMAGLIHGNLIGLGFKASLTLASKLAGKKCGQYGLDGLTL